MYNVIINNVKCLFLQNSFFLSQKNRDFDIQLENGTVFVTSSVEHKDKKTQSGLNCHNAGLHIA